MPACTDSLAGAHCGKRARRKRNCGNADRDRTECIARLKRCLGEMVVGGIETTIPLFQDLLQQPDILSGDYNIHWLERWIKSEL